jgi:hypothetical protein
VGRRQEREADLDRVVVDPVTEAAAGLDERAGDRVLEAALVRLYAGVGE